MRSLVFDVLVALLLVAVGLLLLEVFTQRPDATDRTFVVLVNLPLALRRRLPRAGFLLCWGSGLVQVLAGAPIGVHDAGLLFALYSAVGSTSPSFGLVALALATATTLTGSVAGWWGWVDRQLMTDPGPGTRAASLVGALVLVGCGWALGRRLFTARLGAIALAERAERAEREQRQQAALAAAEERARIAREMHDVVAHGLTVMVLQADAASYVLEQRPADARRAIEQIAATGRESMAQMRSLLGLLRHDDDTPVRAPGLDDLAGLVQEATLAGAGVTLRQADTGEVPPLVALTAYRVVQEGLTNARKHGGPEVLVEVGRQVRQGRPPVLVVRVTNAPPPRDRPALGDEAALRSGLGLQGARERVAAVGGTMTAGPGADGRFVLEVELPV